MSRLIQEILQEVCNSPAPEAKYGKTKIRWMLHQVAVEDPKWFLTYMASLLPKEIKAEIETREYKHVDIATAVHTLEEIMETAGAGDPGSNGEASGTDRPLLPPPVHPQ